MIFCIILVLAYLPLAVPEMPLRQQNEKDHLSDDDLVSSSIPETPEIDKNVIRRSLVKVPEDEGDEFLFRRLGKQLKGQWTKLLERYPQGFFHRTQEAKKNTTSFGASPELTASIISNEPEEIALPVKAAKSALFLPHFGLQTSDESRPVVPFISDLLQIQVETELTNFGLFDANPLFAIKCQYGKLSWTVHRRLLDIFRLHSFLLICQFQGTWPATAQGIPHFPNQFSYLLDVSKLNRIKTQAARAEKRDRLLEERRQAIELYLQKLVRALNMIPIAELCEFFEFSGITLVRQQQGTKLKEGYLRNRIFEAPKQKKSGWLRYMVFFEWWPSWLKRRRYQTKWFVLRPSYLMYLDDLDQSLPSDVLLFDPHFRIEIENELTRSILKPFRVTIRNGSKFLEVRPENNTQMPYWLAQLGDLSMKSLWARAHRFGSFAPIRTGCLLKWLIDGEAYFESLYTALLEAKREIFIHGWWLSPEIYLRRPGAENPQARLDRLLLAKAQEGVKIHIVVFKELTLALSIDSYHTKTALESLHPNIRVQRHPDHFAGGVLYWAHHEKVVVIDQKIAFCGGLDLAFGRFDNSQHALSDFNGMWIGIDYSNPRIKDFRNVVNHSTSLVDRSSVPRMPWHDVHCRVEGQIAADLARHFIQSWNFIKSQKAMQSKLEDLPFLLPNEEFDWEAADKSSDEPTVSCQVVRSSSEWSLGIPTEHSIYEAYLQLIDTAEHFIYIENQFLVTQSSSNGTGPVRNRIGEALVKRIIRAHREAKPFRVVVVMPLLPAFEAAVDSPEASCIRVIMQYQYASISKGPHSIIGQLKAAGIDDYSQYIDFFSLRTHGILPATGQPCTEQLYVHSKLAIFDDCRAILGSANINDRSLMGSRDSEVALVIEDESFITIPGSERVVGKSVSALRLKLWSEHMALTPEEATLLLDTCNTEAYDHLVKGPAARNTQIYRELFHCVPDDSVQSWPEYALFTENPRVALMDDSRWDGIDGMHNLELVRGNLVAFPFNFLMQEQLTPHVLSAEYLLPTEVYI